MDRDISPPPSKRRKTCQAAPPKPVAAQPPPSPSTLRIFSWNINGISPFLQNPITSYFHSSSASSRPSIPPASLRFFLCHHAWPALLLLQEVKIASSDTKTQDAVRTAVNTRSASDKGPKYEVHFTLPTDPHNARGLRGNGKVYGVCSITRSGLSSTFSNVRVRNVDWDSEGRASVVELASPTLKMAVFNLYAVNGTENPFRDPGTGAVRGTRHERKLEFHRLLMEECKAMEGDGWEILLGGDMNVAPSHRDGYPKLRTFPHQHVLSRADFLEKFLGEGEGGFEGVDVWREMHGEERRYTYFPRNREWGSSCDRVDYFVAGRGLWESGMVSACGILDSGEERGSSDHVPIWADISLADAGEEEEK